MERGAHILVVEGDDAVRARVEATLRDAGLHVHAARSGEEALSLLEALAPDVRPGLLGRSPAFLTLLADIQRAAEGDEPVLVSGERGTERAAVARALHLASRRAAGPFTSLQCAGLAAQQQAAQLFGDGGRIAAADGGSLHLEDIEALAAPVQERLEAALALASRARLGAVVAPDFRLLASSTVRLADALRGQGRRAELSLRLAASEVAIPPLRVRGEDVVLLADHDAAAHAATLRRPPPSLHADAVQALRSHPWAGNRDELRQVIEQAVGRAGGRVVHLADLELGPAAPARPASAPWSRDSLRLLDLEREAILVALERAAGNRTGASRELGISRATLYRKLKEHGIE